MEVCSIPSCETHCPLYNPALAVFSKCCQCQAAGLISTTYCQLHSEHEGGSYIVSHLVEYSLLNNITTAINNNSILRQQLFVRNSDWNSWGQDKSIDDSLINEVVTLCFSKKWCAGDILGNSYCALKNRQYLANNIVTHHDGPPGNHFALRAVSVDDCQSFLKLLSTTLTSVTCQDVMELLQMIHVLLAKKRWEKIACIFAKNIKFTRSIHMQWIIRQL